MLWQEFDKSAAAHFQLYFKCSVSLTGLPWCLRWQRILLQCRRSKRHGFDPWVRKISWRREWQSTPAFPGKFHGQRSLVGYSPWGHKESDMTDRLTLTLSRLIEQNELNNILKITGIWRSLINNNSLPTLHLSHFQFRPYVALWWIFLLQGCSQRSPKTIFNQIKELIKAKRKCIHFSFQAPKGWSCFLFVWSRLNWPNAIEQRKFLILVLKLVLVLQNGLETINREQPLPNHELESSYTFIMKAPWITS